MTGHEGEGGGGGGTQGCEATRRGAREHRTSWRDNAANAETFRPVLLIIIRTMIHSQWIGRGSRRTQRGALRAGANPSTLGAVASAGLGRARNTRDARSATHLTAREAADGDDHSPLVSAAARGNQREAERCAFCCFCALPLAEFGLAKSQKSLYFARLRSKMTDELEKHVLKKYEVAQKLGKGVSRAAALRLLAPARGRSALPASASAPRIPPRAPSYARPPLPLSQSPPPSVGLRHRLEGDRPPHARRRRAQEVL
jgi:hypothetical protein